MVFILMVAFQNHFWCHKASTVFPNYEDGKQKCKEKLLFRISKVLFPMCILVTDWENGKKRCAFSNEKFYLALSCEKNTTKNKNKQTNYKDTKWEIKTKWLVKHYS